MPGHSPLLFLTLVAQNPRQSAKRHTRPGPAGQDCPSSSATLLPPVAFLAGCGGTRKAPDAPDSRPCPPLGRPRPREGPAAAMGVLFLCVELCRTWLSVAGGTPQQRGVVAAADIENGPPTASALQRRPLACMPIGQPPPLTLGGHEAVTSAGRPSGSRTWQIASRPAPVQPY